MKQSQWKTYRAMGYTHDVAQDQASAGGAHLHQVRRSSAGWQYRILQSNGRHQAPGAVESISDAEGETKYAQATEY